MAGPPPDRPRASDILQELGFTPFETVNLLDLRRRYERGEFGDTLPAQRLRFARWLVRRGRLGEGQVKPSPRTDPSGARTLDALLPSGRSEDLHASPGVPCSTAGATVERCNVRAPRLVFQDELTARSWPMAPVRPVPMGGSRLMPGVVALVLLLSMLGAFGAYVLVAAAIP